MYKYKANRILFVCYANSAHALPWVSLLDNSGFEVRIFSTPLRTEQSNTRPWPYPTYLLVKPEMGSGLRNKVYSLLPGKPFSGVSRYFEDRLALNSCYLRYVLRTWRPDILHSMPLDVGGKLTWQALKGMPRYLWPNWVASSWGSDLSFGLHHPQKVSLIKNILANCNGFMADSKYDLDLAVSAGLDKSKLAFQEPKPGNGGLDLSAFEKFRDHSIPRDIILIPKAFEREHANRTLSIIEALRILGDHTLGYSIHFVACSEQVLWYLKSLPREIESRCFCHPSIDQNDLFGLMARSRVVLAPSLSDGTPNVMLEAMASGALPLMSPIPTHEEWIKHGQNGLLAHALYPNCIAAALKRALNDDGLFENARSLNWAIVRQRADRREVSNSIRKYYESLL